MIFYVATAAQAPRGSVLEAKAAALSAAGKFHEAGDAYTSAAKAHTTEGNNSAAARAYGKGTGGTYAIKVPPGSYRVSAYATYLYYGRWLDGACRND